jgi:hypothetical protein
MPLENHVEGLQGTIIEVMEWDLHRAPSFRGILWKARSDSVESTHACAITVVIYKADESSWPSVLDRDLGDCRFKCNSCGILRRRNFVQKSDVDNCSFN